jgi:hypothetical protein
MAMTIPKKRLISGPASHCDDPGSLKMSNLLDSTGARE